MSPREYRNYIEAYTGLTYAKWIRLREQCREEAQKTGKPVEELYKKYDLIVPKSTVKNEPTPEWLAFRDKRNAYRRNAYKHVKQNCLTTNQQIAL